MSNVAHISGKRRRVRPGALLLEALLAIAMFALFASATFLPLLTGQESTRTGSARVRGVYYTEQALEVVKAIRDGGWSDTGSGKYGYSLSESGTWLLTGTDLSRYGYDTYIIVSPNASGTIKDVHVRSAWKHGYHRSGATTLSMQIANWRSSGGVGDWSSPTLTGSTTVPTTVNFNDLIVYKNYAYLTSEVGTYGDGLYIYDVSDPTSPSRVSSAFTLPGTAHKPVAYSDRIYVMVEDGSDPEIKAYDISDPTGLNGSTTPLATYNLSGGTNRGRSLAIHDGTLYAGAIGDASESEFYSFNITTGSSIILVDELALDNDPTVHDIFTRGDYAYLATDGNTEELYVVNISNPASMSGWTVYSATSTEDGYAARAYGTGFYLGRASAATDEYLLITGSGGKPSSAPANTHGAEIGGNVNAMDIDPLGCYAFMATSNTTKELQIRSARYKGVDEEVSENLTTGAGRGIFYDYVNDLLYLTTESGMYIYDAGSPSTCS